MMGCFVENCAVPLVDVVLLFEVVLLALVFFLLLLL
jgi:hypothetical protein